MTQSDWHDWHGQNIPLVHKEWDGSSFAMLPVLEFLLKYDEETIGDLLPHAKSYGWNDGFMDTLAWAQNYDKVTYLEPDFTRYGCLPRWFPKTDIDGRALTSQGQVNRFLYLLDCAYGGLPDDHHEANPHGVALALIELHENNGEYTDIEVGDGMEWEPA
jgi:hypothetical protein